MVGASSVPAALKPPGCLPKKHSNFSAELLWAKIPPESQAAIIGHESELVSRNYTHVDDATKRKAIRNLPTISKTPGKLSA